MTETSILSHLTNSMLVVTLLQYLKGTVWYTRFASALPIADSKVHVVMSGIGAFAAAVGMHGAVKGSSGVGWEIALAIPPLWVLLHSIWDWGQQLALNQLIFAITVQQKKAAPVITEVVTPKVSVTAPLVDAVGH
jgi:hypothetical protein